MPQIHRSISIDCLNLKFKYVIRLTERRNYTENQSEILL